MAWSNVHDDAPTDDDGVPYHPEKGYPICGYEKTDAVDTVNNAKRHDIPYCLQAAGWGTDRTTGHCRNHHGASPGAPEGWRNGNAKHLLYSQRMSDDDREIFDALVQNPDGDGLMPLSAAIDMLKNAIAWEQTRLIRAIEAIEDGGHADTPPADVELVEVFACPECDSKHREPAGDCNEIIANPPDGPVVRCDYTGDFDRVDKFVHFGDKSVERKESHLASLIKTVKMVDEGADVNVTGDHDVTHKGDADAPVEVSITHAGVDLPDDATVDADRGDGEDE